MARKSSSGRLIAQVIGKAVQSIRPVIERRKQADGDLRQLMEELELFGTPLLHETKDYGVIEGTPVARCWSDIAPCSGQMRVRLHAFTCPLWLGSECDCWVSQRVRVYTHRHPMFVQCDECGHAPLFELKEYKPLSR